MIDRLTIDKILDATDIVDVVSEFVTLRKAGINYKGLCPFHDDKTPSFIVSPAKGICHCLIFTVDGCRVAKTIEFNHLRRFFKTFLVIFNFKYSENWG